MCCSVSFSPVWWAGSVSLARKDSTTIWESHVERCFLQDGKETGFRQENGKPIAPARMKGGPRRFNRKPIHGQSTLARLPILRETSCLLNSRLKAGFRDTREFVHQRTILICNNLLVVGLHTCKMRTQRTSVAPHTPPDAARPYRSRLFACCRRQCVPGA